MDESYYTLKQVSARLNVSIRTVSRIIERHELSVTVVGKQIRISEDQLSDYLKRHTLLAKDS